MNSEYEKFLDISNKMSQDKKYLPDVYWDNSPFKWMTTLTSRTVGSVAEKLIEEWAAGCGFEVQKPSGSTDYDRVINGKKVEIKYSRRWKDSGHYRFQQIRNQEYEYILWLGISADSVNCWYIPKGVLGISSGTPAEGIVPQHGGKTGRDTWVIDLHPEDQPSWLLPYGDTLE